MDNPKHLSMNNYERILKLCIQREHETAFVGLLECFHEMEKYQAIRFIDDLPGEFISRQMTVLATCILTLMGDPTFVLNRNGFSAFMSLKGHIRSVFQMSAFQNMQHVINLVSDYRDGQFHLADENAMRKFLICCTPDLLPPWINNLLQSVEEEERTLFWLTSLDARYVLSDEDEHSRDSMLALKDWFSKSYVKSNAEMQALTRVWMHCSYWDLDGKHEIKKTLNTMLKNTAGYYGVKDPVAPSLSGKIKPKLVVVTEIWLSGSAMHRCFSGVFLQLMDRFDVVLYCADGQSDAESESIFSEVCRYGNHGSLQAEVDALSGLEPDIIFYPSVGMLSTTVFLAQFRLAAIQVVGMGHPATTFSEAIDYVVFDEDYLPDPDVFSEKVLLLRKGTIPFTRPVNAALRQKIHDPEAEVVHVSVNCLYYKLTPRFLKICGRIQNTAEKRVQFHFLAGLTSFNSEHITRIVNSHVPGAKTYEYLEYKRYSEVIAGCDLQLTPFPFGNTNSLIDALMHSLPSVCMDGREFHSHLDTALARRVGVPEVLIASNEAEYLSSALKLINDLDFRLSQRDRIAKLDLDELFFFSDKSTEQGDLADLFEWIIANHADVSRSDKKVWRVEDRLP